MSGKQVSQDGRDIILIEGQVVLNTPSAFLMLGKIDVDLKRYRDEGITRCRREGAFTFRRTGKYLRLLEKSEHCDYVTDYIDIFL